MNHIVGKHLHHFHGGLRLRHYKQMSCTDTPTHLAPPPQLIVNLQQHKGYSAKPVVNPGEYVLRGQVIARTDNHLTQQLHAPSSGTISAIEERPYISANALCIVIDCDGKDQAIPADALNNWQQSTPEQVIDHINKMGVVGLGGAVFPTAKKLTNPHDNNTPLTQEHIHTIILNGAECEPYLSCDESLMLSQPEQLINGARILAHAASAKHIVVAIEDRMNEVLKRLHQVITEHHIDNIQVIQVPTYYPEGGERQLIQVLTGQEVPAQGLPRDLGLLCFNVATAVACHNAVELGQALTERIVTVTGRCIQRPGNWWARIGSPVESLIDAAGGLSHPAERLIMGGPMMGSALPHTDIPIVKASNCILALDATEIHDAQGEMPCINCGFCVRVCPAHLLPQELHWSIRSEDIQRAQNYGLTDCIECGCCDQVCPSHIPLVEDYRLGKHKLRVMEQEKRRAEQAKKRYEARQLRLERLEQVRQKQRETSKTKNTPKDAKSRIAAALAKKKKQQQAVSATGNKEAIEDKQKT